jgi:hypothetical protein
VHGDQFGRPDWFDGFAQYPHRLIEAAMQLRAKAQCQGGTGLIGEIANALKTEFAKIGDQR